MTNKQPRWLGNTSRALGIVRVSSKKQGDNNSPGVQRDGIRAYAVANDLDLVEVVQIEESAKSSEARVKFHAALEKAKRNKARHLVFWVWDRSTRNFTDYELLEDLIRRDEMVLHVAHEHWQLHAGSDEFENARGLTRLDGESPRIAVTNDAAGGRMVEVRAEHEHGPFGVPR